MPLVISDASTLIHLAAIGRLGLLKEFYDKVIVPPACVGIGPASIASRLFWLDEGLRGEALGAVGENVHRAPGD